MAHHVEARLPRQLMSVRIMSGHSALINGIAFSAESREQQLVRLVAQHLAQHVRDRLVVLHHHDSGGRREQRRGRGGRGASAIGDGFGSCDLPGISACARVRSRRCGGVPPSWRARAHVRLRPAVRWGPCRRAAKRPRRRTTLSLPMRGKRCSSSARTQPLGAAGAPARDRVSGSTTREAHRRRAAPGCRIRAASASAPARTRPAPGHRCRCRSSG